MLPSVPHNWNCLYNRLPILWYPWEVPRNGEPGSLLMPAEGL